MAIALAPEVPVASALREPLLTIVVSPASPAVVRVSAGLRAREVATVSEKRSTCH